MSDSKESNQSTLSLDVGKEFTRTASMSSSDSMKTSLTTPKPTLDAGAFRSIPLEFCEVFWNQLGSGRSAGTQVIWYSPTNEEDR